MGLKDDLDRYREVGENRRQDLAEFIQYGDLGNSRRDQVRIPIKIIDLPEFEYDQRDMGGVGQGGDGTPEPGDPVGQPQEDGDEDDYKGDKPHEEVRKFRNEKIITALNRHAWRHRDEEFQVSDVNPKEIPVIKSVLGTHDWDDVRRTFEDFDPYQWDNPPGGTETADIKADTIGNMQDLYDYSEASAELTSRHVMSQVSYKWD